MRTVFSFALGAAAGAAAARFLTPATGRQLSDQAASKASGVASTVTSQAKYAAGQAKGMAASVTPSPGADDMDDMTLADRVRTEIFRDAAAPKSGVSVDVQAGVAYLRGEVPDQRWIDRFGTEARDVQGIKGVKNLLHTPGTPTPPAEPRFLASEQHRP